MYVYHALLIIQFTKIWTQFIRFLESHH